LNLTRAAPARFVRAADAGGPERDFHSLPLDYFAPGPQYLYGRSAWGENATTFHVQFGPLEGTGHAHYDAGNWQIWRNGRWLSRETVAYSENLAGYANNGVTPAGDSPMHNVILMNGRGLAYSPSNGGARLRRLESRPDYVYAAADLTPAYRNHQVPSPRRDRDNPVVAHVEREFLFLRPLETMVVLDRLESNSSVMPAASVVKTFLAHFEQMPVIEDAGNVLAVNGDQALRITTLVPSAPSHRIVNEGGTVGQYRLEMETSGSAQSYFLNVMQARDAAGQNLQAAVSETAASFTVTLSLAGRGYCRIVFEKGMVSAGGGVSCSPAAMPAGVEPFLSRVQGIEVTDDGPVWEALPGSASPPPPWFAAGAVVDPWTYQAGLSPGGWATITGLRLSATTAVWNPIEGQPIATTLGGVTVRINGTPAVLSYVSETLVNILAPAGLPEGTATIVVERDGVASAPVTVQVKRMHPAIYSLPLREAEGEKWYVTAALAGTSRLVGTRRADARVQRGARPGEWIDLYVVGLGRTVGDPPAGSFFRGAFPVAGPVEVALGEEPLTPAFAGLISPGLYSVRIRIPEDFPARDAPIRVVSGEISSAAGVYLTVEHAGAGGESASAAGGARR
jgi:uncharacterized protein (TIGR03437 family)